MDKINVVLAIHRRIISRAEKESERRRREIGFSVIFDNIDFIRRKVKVEPVYFSLVYGRVLLDLRRVQLCAFRVYFS